MIGLQHRNTARAALRLAEAVPDSSSVASSNASHLASRHALKSRY